MDGFASMTYGESQEEERSVHSSSVCFDLYPTRLKIRLSVCVGDGVFFRQIQRSMGCRVLEYISSRWHTAQFQAARISWRELTSWSFREASDLGGHAFLMTAQPVTWDNLLSGSGRFKKTARVSSLANPSSLTSVARKRPRRFCEKCKRQVTATSMHTPSHWTHTSI